MTNPDRVAFTIAGREIYWYGILMAVGILIAVLLAMREAKRKGMHEDAMIDACFVIIPAGVIGARLYYVLFELPRYLANPISILYIWEGGLAIYGAVIGGLLGLYFHARYKKVRFLKYADCIAPGLVLAQAIGRWGNFFNQEAYGPPITNPDMWWFPFAVRIDAPWLTVHYFNGEVCTNPYHMATFFYESMWCLAVFVFLWGRRKRFRHDGDALLWYVILYGFERMFMEALRGDSLFAGDIRISQLVSALLFVGGVAFMLVRMSREKRIGRLCWPAPVAAVEAGDAGEDEESGVKMHEPAAGEFGAEDFQEEAPVGEETVSEEPADEVQESVEPAPGEAQETPNTDTETKEDGPGE